MNAENIFKSWFTSLLGGVIMILSLYDWWWLGEEITKAIWPFVGGFALLMMKDKVSDLINQAFEVVINRMRGGPPTTPKP